MILGYPEKSDFKGGGGGSQKPICLKTGAWTVCRFKKELGKKEGLGVFEGGLIPECNL